MITELKFSGNVPYDIYCDMTLSFFCLKKANIIFWPSFWQKRMAKIWPKLCRMGPGDERTKFANIGNVISLSKP